MYMYNKSFYFTESFNTNVIKLFFSDNINDEYGTLSPSQVLQRYNLLLSLFMCDYLFVFFLKHKYCKIFIIYFFSIFEQKNTFKSCSWCIIVSSDPDSDTLGNVLYSNGIGNVSIVPPDVDALWNTLTSAMELPLIDFLKEKKEKALTSERDGEDIETVVRRIERYSEFPHVKSKHETPNIPTKINDVLKRCLSVCPSVCQSFCQSV